ncbi:MAG: tetratricopeptide repeat protein [Rhodospirillaceae bacterium]
MSILIDGTGAPLSSGSPAQPAPGGAAPAGASASGDLVKDTDMDHFMEDVIEASKTVPVVIDFWAPWCGPCKTLGPLLEKHVRAKGGAVKMVKINVDENQPLAAQFRIQSIPMIYAIKDGQPIDGLSGAVPESEIKAFLDRIAQGAGDLIEDAYEEAARLLDAGEPHEAAEIYQELFTADPSEVRAFAGFAKCLAALGQVEDAKGFLGRLPPAMANHAEVKAVLTTLDLAERTGAVGAADGLRAKVEANPDDHQARMDYALALYGDSRPGEAVDQLLEICRRDRSWNDDGARKEVVKIFEALGHTHPVTLAGRRKLSSILFS